MLPNIFGIFIKLVNEWIKWNGIKNMDDGALGNEEMTILAHKRLWELKLH